MYTCCCLNTYLSHGDLVSWAGFQMGWAEILGGSRLLQWSEGWEWIFLVLATWGNRPVLSSDVSTWKANMSLWAMLVGSGLGVAEDVAKWLGRVASAKEKLLAGNPQCTGISQMVSSMSMLLSLSSPCCSWALRKVWFKWYRISSVVPESSSRWVFTLVPCTPCGLGSREACLLSGRSYCYC